MIYYLKSFAFFIREAGGRRLRFRKQAHREDNFLNPFQGQTGMKVLDVAEKNTAQKQNLFSEVNVLSKLSFFRA